MIKRQPETEPSVLVEPPPKHSRSILCRLLRKHTNRVVVQVGDDYEKLRCMRCNVVTHRFTTPGLSEDEMRAQANRHGQHVQAVMWLLDNVEPTYAAGRGCKDGKIIDQEG